MSFGAIAPEQTDTRTPIESQVSGIMRTVLWFLTPYQGRSIIEVMKSTRLFHSKEKYARGFIEIVIWEVPIPVHPSEHPYKYRLVYVVDGMRVVRYDNERGKGDHKHLNDREEPYRFVSPSRLVTDFMFDVDGVENGG